MDKKFFYALIACMLFTLGLQFAYQKFFPHAAPPFKSPTSAVTPGGTDARPSAPGTTAATASSAAVTPAADGDSLVASELTAAAGAIGWLPAGGPATATLEKGTLRVTISSAGGALASAQLRSFRLVDGAPVDLVGRGRSGALAMSLVLAGRTLDLAQVPFTLTTERDRATGADRVRAVATQANGLRIERTYEITSEYKMVTAVTLTGVPGGQRTAPQFALRWDAGLPGLERNPQQDQPHYATVSLVGADFHQDHPKDFGKHPSKTYPGSVRWAGVRSKYFLAAVIPPTGASTNLMASGVKDAQLTRFEMWFPVLVTAPTSHTFQVYLGPIDYHPLQDYGVNIERVANMGWSWTQPLSRILLWLMIKLYSFIPNYGVAIILVSAITKLAFYPLTRSSFKSMAEMQRIQPMLKQLQVKLKDNPEKLNKETMALFKEHKVNPVGGCLPMVVQMPVFVALYGVFSSAVQLRDAPFVWWIQDLSSPDVVATIGTFAVHMLPVLMTVTSIIQAMMTPTDPRQRSMTYMMPIMMLFLFYPLPAGLVLYWTINNIMTIAQQYMMKMHVAHEPVVAVLTPAVRGGKK